MLRCLLFREPARPPMLDIGSENRTPHTAEIRLSKPKDHFTQIS